MVCRSDAVVTPEKMAQPIDIPFGLRSPLGQRNHVLDGGPSPPWEGAILREGKGWPVAEYSDSAKTAEPIEMPFGTWTQVVTRKHVLAGVHTSATWRIPLNRPRAATMRPVVKLLDHLLLLLL